MTKSECVKMARNWNHAILEARQNKVPLYQFKAIRERRKELMEMARSYVGPGY